MYITSYLLALLPLKCAYHIYVHTGASEEELCTQKKFLESYYGNKKNNLVDCVESIERYEELKMEVIEEARKVIMIHTLHLSS